MGIQGLLPLLKSIQHTRHIREFEGKTVGVDAYGWLHRGAIGCAVDLALGKPTTQYVNYVMNFVRMLLHFGVKPYLVFDGDYLPSKAGTEGEREAKREEKRTRGIELLNAGKTTLAYNELRGAIDITPNMAADVIAECRKLNVKCIVAPYEADAQLYYLEKIGEIQAIISEDSDLLVFGCKTLITKLDKYGECVEINRDNLSRTKDISLAGFSDKEFRYMAILSGCDYLDSVPGVGLKTAHRYVRRHKEVERIIKAMQYDYGAAVPVDYIQSFKRANTTFLHQRVYDPIQRKMVMCNEPDEPLSDEDLIFIGVELEEHLARGVACGVLHPITKEVMKLTATASVVTTSVTQTIKRAAMTPEKQSPKPTPSAQSQTILTFFSKDPRTPTPQGLSQKSQVPKSAPPAIIPAKRALVSATPTTARKACKTIKEKLFEDAPEESPYFSNLAKPKGRPASESKTEKCQQRGITPMKPIISSSKWNSPPSDENKENIDPNASFDGFTSLQSSRPKNARLSLGENQLFKRGSAPELRRMSLSQTPAKTLINRASMPSFKPVGDFEDVSKTFDSILPKRRSTLSNNQSESPCGSEWLDISVKKTARRSIGSFGFQEISLSGKSRR